MRVAGGFAAAWLVAVATGCGGAAGAGTSDGAAGVGGADAQAGDAPDGATAEGGADASAGAPGPDAATADGPVDVVATGDGATDAGDAACACFAHGNWDIDNLSPCFFSTGGAGTSGAVSTVTEGQNVTCPNDFTEAPTTAWSTDTLETDCAGHYKLCITLRAGDPQNPRPTDCIVATSCAESDYATPDVTQTWPPLPSWITTGTQSTCAQMMAATGGYGVTTVSGTPTGCGAISKSLSLITYCPASCLPPTCSCQAGGSGNF